MGRIYETRKYVMFARFARMSKAFNRIGREINVAVKMADLIRKATRGSVSPYKTQKASTCRRIALSRYQTCIGQRHNRLWRKLFYEGYAPHGIGIVVECTTDNPTRHCCKRPALFNQSGGSLGSSGSLMFMFERKRTYPHPRRLRFLILMNSN